MADGKPLDESNIIPTVSESLEHDRKSKKPIKTKTRRGYGRKHKRQIGKGRAEFSLMGSNANGIQAKKSSLKENINFFQPSAITLQETKLRRTGTLKLTGYQIFEKVRSGYGGGLLTAVNENLSPVLISTGKCEESEILVVQCKAQNYDIRIINAYGPQEDLFNKEKIYSFWQELEQEVVTAIEDECLVVIELDANAKLGSEHNEDDPHNVTENGKLLLDIAQRQNLSIVNTMDVCEGVITRERITKNRVERSVLDYVIVCQRMKDFVKKMVIDEDRIHVLTKYASKKGLKKHKLSDHNILFSKFSIHVEDKPRKVRKEIFLMKNKESQELFYEETSKSNFLTSSFSQGSDFPRNASIFFKRLNSCIHKCFKKVRIKSGGSAYQSDQPNIKEKLVMKRKLKIFLMNNKCQEYRGIVEGKIKEIDNYLIEKCAAKNAEIIKQHFREVESPDGSFCQLNLWKLKKKLFPKQCDPPMGKKNEQGNLITAPNLLRDLYLRTYQGRLRHRKMKEDLQDLFFLKEELCSSRMEELRNKKTPPWQLSDLTKALKSLKKNKTSDPNGMINEIFKTGVGGSDLQEAMLLLFNGVKANLFLPSYMLLENITTLFKNKGSRFEMNNDRGIFILTVLKKILDKLIYQDNSENIDDRMTDSNIGARRNRSIKNHLFIIYGIINSVIKGKEASIDIQIYDIEKAFDALWLDECLNDLFDTISEDHRNDKIVLLYESNRDNLVAVKTAVGMTERVNMPKIVQQGGTWGPVLCSNTIDKIGKKSRESGKYQYKYKNTVGVLPLAMVDDINAISKCGVESVELNSFINTEIEMKKLKFHVPDVNGKSKCHKMHIGTKHGCCPILKVHNTVVEEVTEDTYLGDILSSDGRNNKNIANRISKGIGIISQMMHMLESLSLGEHYFEIAILFREAMFLNGILTNSEIWYNLSESDINEFESLDRLLLRRILNVPVSTPKEALYLELGILPIGWIIKSRRINFFHYLVNRDEEEMLYKFFLTQFNKPCRGDWTETVKQDLEDLGVKWDFDFLKSKSKDAFKRLVKNKVKEVALEDLKAKQKQHSKMENIQYIELKQQKYFSIGKIGVEEIRNIFRFRVRMAKYGENFRGILKNVMCPLCYSHLDSQSQSFQCKELRSKIDIRCDIKDIYSDDVSVETVKTVAEMMKQRQLIINTYR